MFGAGFTASGPRCSRVAEMSRPGGRLKTLASDTADCRNEYLRQCAPRGAPVQFTVQRTARSATVQSTAVLSGRANGATAASNNDETQPGSNQFSRLQQKPAGEQAKQPKTENKYVEICLMWVRVI